VRLFTDRVDLFFVAKVIAGLLFALAASRFLLSILALTVGVPLRGPIAAAPVQSAVIHGLGTLLGLVVFRAVERWRRRVRGELDSR